MAAEGPEAALRAARADSAAAGYPVMPTPEESARDSAIAAPLVAWLHRHFGEGDPALPARPPVILAARTPVSSPPADSTATPATPVSPAAPVVPPPSARPLGSPPASDTATTRRGPDSSPDVPAGDPPPDSVLTIGDFLAYNPARRTVALRAAAGYDGSNGSLNFNGAAHGSRTVVVPLGWTVEVRFEQGDDALAHSALVAIAQDPMPLDAPEPAFPGATTQRTAAGILAGGTDAFTFLAERTGRYVLQCGVPGHAQAGMWLRIAIDSTAAAPRYR